MRGLRLAFSTTLLLGGLFSPVAAEAQQAAKIARIGFLAGSLAANPHLPEAFRQGLRDLGYVEGRNLVIEYRDAEGTLERLPALAAELVALKVDVIVTSGGTPAALAAKQATRTFPIVFAAHADPIGSGLVTSLARPGGNVTGLSILSLELVGKCVRAAEARPASSVAPLQEGRPRSWLARVGAHHRALAVEALDALVWFWIGTHADYDRLLG